MITAFLVLLIFYFGVFVGAFFSRAMHKGYFK